jgi:hypothetical protein
MTIPHILFIFAMCLSLTGAHAYVRDTLKGITKPNKISWGLWALAPIVASYISITNGADPWTVTRTFSAGFGPLLVFIVSFVNKNAYWKLSTFDYACGAMSLIAMYFWLGADSPRVAIVLLALADLFASIPVIVKAWKFPETETGYTFFMASLISVLTLPITPVWNIENAAFPAYLLLANFALMFACYRTKIRNFF